MAVKDRAVSLASLAQRQADRILPPSTRREAWDQTLDFAARRPAVFVRPASTQPPNPHVCTNQSPDLPSNPNNRLPPSDPPLHDFRHLHLPPLPRCRDPLHPLLDRRRPLAARPHALRRVRASHLRLGLDRHLLHHRPIRRPAPGLGPSREWPDPAREEPGRTTRWRRRKGLWRDRVRWEAPEYKRDCGGR
jgi:hypothetical protein